MYDDLNGSDDYSATDDSLDGELQCVNFYVKEITDILVIEDQKSE